MKMEVTNLVRSNCRGLIVTKLTFTINFSILLHIYQLISVYLSSIHQYIATTLHPKDPSQRLTTKRIYDKNLESRCNRELRLKIINSAVESVKLECF